MVIYGDKYGEIRLYLFFAYFDISNQFISLISICWYVCRPECILDNISVAKDVLNCFGLMYKNRILTKKKLESC